MPTITEVGNSSNSYSFPDFDSWDEFIPYVALDSVTFPESDATVKEKDKYKLFPDEDDRVTLSEHIDKGFQNHGVEVLTTREQKIKLTFSVTKASEDSYDPDGVIGVILSINDPTIQITSPEKMPITTQYQKTITIELEMTSEEAKEFYIDFYANDNDDFFEGEYKDVYCGRIKIVFEVPKSSKVGLRLTSNIENLPLAPSNYLKPPTFGDPTKSFEVANTYQNCHGMCFAVSMARVRQAYLDEFNTEVISLDIQSTDFRYSGTVTHKIPDMYLGYGVGGALAAKGYAELIDEGQIWSGELQEGAMLQFWNDYDNLGFDSIKKAIKNTLSSGTLHENFDGGHSVIFKAYIYNASNEIVGLKCHDYRKLNRQYYKGGGEIFLGANLKDLK